MENLKDKTIKELKDICRKNKIKGFSNKNKKELISLIQSFQKEKIKNKTSEIKKTEPSITPINVKKNRIQDAINRINDKLKNLEKDKIKNLENSMNDVSFSELVAYQNAQSRAFASGKINLEEAQLLYNILGREVPTVDKFKKRSLAEKIVVMQTMGELIRR